MPESADGRRAVDPEQSSRAKPRYSVERQQEISRILRREGSIDATAVARELDVTTETIRKDLIRMERAGQLARVHGGAVPVGSHSLEPDVTSRTEHAAEKRRIAAAALHHLPEAGSVLIDAGSTTAELVDLFPDDRELTVFTHVVPFALALLARPQLAVYTIGGRVRRQTLAAVGAWTSRVLDELNVDVAFLGTNGFTIERGLTTPEPAEAEIKRRMVGCAQRRILLADHSKFGQLSLVQHAELPDIHLLITDSGMSDADADRLKSAGLPVERA